MLGYLGTVLYYNQGRPSKWDACLGHAFGVSGKVSKLYKNEFFSSFVLSSSASASGYPTTPSPYGQPTTGSTGQPTVAKHKQTGFFSPNTNQETNDEIEEIKVVTSSSGSDSSATPPLTGDPHFHTLTCSSPARNKDDGMEVVTSSNGSGSSATPPLRDGVHLNSHISPMRLLSTALNFDTRRREGNAMNESGSCDRSPISTWTNTIQRCIFAQLTANPSDAGMDQPPRHGMGSTLVASARKIVGGIRAIFFREKEAVNADVQTTMDANGTSCDGPARALFGSEHEATNKEKDKRRCTNHLQRDQ